MAVTYSTAVKDDRMNAVDDAINTGVGTAVLEIGTAGMGTVLATINLQNPAFGSSSSGVITLQGVPLSDTSADAGGTAAEARIKDRDGANVITGLTVGTGSEDIVLDSTSISAGQQVTINSGTLTHG
jgi:hypothetical protein